MGDSVLITGSTGHIGFHVLLKTLQAGYMVRAAVRSHEKAESLLSIQALQRFPRERLAFTIVPDLTEEGAYDESLRDGIKYVIHIASPIPPDGLSKDEFESHLIHPAVQGRLGLLESAKRARTVRRVVITSSIAALMPFDAMQAPADTVFTSESRYPTPDLKMLQHPLEAYAASKLATFNNTEEWITKNNPAFDIINIHPSFVMGREEVYPTPNSLLSRGTNRFILGVALGVNFPAPIAGMTVHVEDVARVHVDALDPRIPGNTSYLITSNNPAGSLRGSRFEDVTKVVSEHFSEAVARMELPNTGSLASVAIKADAAKAEKVFRFSHISFERQVIDVVQQYLDLVRTARAQ